MINVPFSLQQKILHHIILHTYDLNEIGFMNGKAGIVSTLYIAGRTLKEPVYTDFADILFDNIIENMHKGLPIYFYNGICGIGWCLNFLLHEKFIFGNTSEICEDINKIIMQINPNRLDDSMSFGFKGLIHYVLANISVSNNVPFDKDFLKNLYKRAINTQNIANDYDLKILCQNYCNFLENKEWEYQFKIEQFINIQTHITEKNYKQQELSLYKGLCGSFLKMI